MNDIGTGQQVAQFHDFCKMMFSSILNEVMLNTILHE